MRIRIPHIISLAIALAIAGGCNPVDGETSTSAPVIGQPVQSVAGGGNPVDGEKNTSATVIGQPVQSVIKTYAGQRIRIFDEKGTELKELPKEQRGSVSIYNKDATGQDNYKFDAKGVIDEHLRSYDEDYGAGVWKEIK